MNAARYAIYYAPAPESPLWGFGSDVLGYDAATGATRLPLAPAGFSPEDWLRLTAQPRRYGFHATLKAPFRLAEGATEDDLVAAGRAFARKRRGFELPELAVRPIETFVALTPKEPSEALSGLAAACVEAFEPFRAPHTAEELARRRLAGLTERQQVNLDRWGYPYVFEDFRFHMTLTGSLPETRVPAAIDGLAALYDEQVGAAVSTVKAVTLYVEESPEDGFRIVDRFVFGS